MCIDLGAVPESLEPAACGYVPECVCSSGCTLRMAVVAYLQRGSLVVCMDSSCAFANIAILGALSLAARTAFAVALVALDGSVSMAGRAVPRYDTGAGLPYNH